MTCRRSPSSNLPGLRPGELTPPFSISMLKSSPVHRRRSQGVQVEETAKSPTHQFHGRGARLRHRDKPTARDGTDDRHRSRVGPGSGFRIDRCSEQYLHRSRDPEQYIRPGFDRGICQSVRASGARWHPARTRWHTAGSDQPSGPRRHTAGPPVSRFRDGRFRLG